MIVYIPIGAPSTGSSTDELIFAGVNKIIIVGYAGSLRKDIPHGSIVVCTKALRDEGVSHHYIGYGKYIETSPKLRKKIISLMKKENIKFYVGPTWTIDAPYMETKEEVEYYRKKGILTIEMEASAMLSVIKRRNKEGYNVEGGAIFLISDVLDVRDESEYNFIMAEEYKKYNIDESVNAISEVLKEV